ncbi:MAG TPA: LCP family protein [Nocardioidaceae bacterium]|nr:LCP family protein [Nocardioidaceae bacterium]
MADRRRGSGDPPEGSPEYNWLYGAKGSARGQGGVPGDPDPTQVLPTSKRSAESAGQGAWGSSAPRTDRLSTAPRGPRPSAQPPRSASRGRKRFGWVKLVLLLWLVFLVAVPLWAWSQIEKVDAEPDGERPGSQPGHTYLLVGSDSREGLSKKQRQDYGTGTGEGRRTDTIMMLHTGAGPNLLLSIPRDSIVDVPGYGQTKVNAAYAYGGPELLVQTLEEETGVGIDSYVEIGFGGFVNVVDAVGGVEICPKQAMKDPLAKLDVEKGCQEADGPTALGYARSRKISQLGDIDRAQRQREVVSAVGDKAASPWSILNPVRYTRLASAGSDSLRLGEDTGPFDTLRFAWAMTRVTGDKGLTCGVPIADLAVTWDRERALRMFEYIKEDRTEEIPKRLCTPSGLAR